MSSPLPPEIFSPEGVPLFLNPYSGTYIKSRSYAARMQRGFAGGISQSEARGHSAAGGVTEYQKRLARAQAEGFTSPWARYKHSQQFQQQWGYSYSYWMRLRRLFIDEINSMIPDPRWQVGPDLISQEFHNENILRLSTGVAGKEFIETQLAHKLTAMQAYRQHDKGPGYMYFRYRDGIRPVEWWYYH